MTQYSTARLPACMGWSKAIGGLLFIRFAPFALLAAHVIHAIPRKKEIGARGTPDLTLTKVRSITRRSAQKITAT